MAGEVLLINPRRRRKSRRTHAKRTHRRRRRHSMVARRNPTRRVRRHRGYARRHRRRLRRNPAFGGSLGGTVMKGATIAGGAIATDVIAGFLATKLPALPNVSADVSRIGAKALVGIAAPVLLRRWLPRGIANALAVGGAVAVTLDIFKTYVAPKLNLPMSGLEVGTLNALEVGALNDYDYAAGDMPASSGSAYGGGAY